MPTSFNSTHVARETILEMLRHHGVAAILDHDLSKKRWMKGSVSRNFRLFGGEGGGQPF